MTQIETYINRLLAERDDLEAKITDIDLKIRVAREIEAEVPRQPADGVLDLSPLPNSKPLIGLGPMKAVAKYMDMNPGLIEIQPYTLYRQLEVNGFSHESKNIRQIIAKTFTEWGEKNDWAKADVGVWRKKFRHALSATG